MASRIAFVGAPSQCGVATLSWTGGARPLRIEIYQQPDAARPWNSTGNGVYDVGTQSDIFQWQVTVPAGVRLWATIVDHSGIYNQSLEPTVVQPSGDDSCLLQTVSNSVMRHSHDGKYVGIGLGIPLAMLFVVVVTLARMLRREKLRNAVAVAPARANQRDLALDSASDVSSPVMSLGHGAMPAFTVTPASPSVPPASPWPAYDDPFADAHRAPSLASTTGTARDHEPALGPLHVRNSELGA